MGAKSKQKKPKKKQKSMGPKKKKRDRLSKIKGNTPDPKRRESKLRG